MEGGGSKFTSCLTMVVAIATLAASVVSCYYGYKTYNRSTGQVTAGIHIFERNDTVYMRSMEELQLAPMTFGIMNTGTEPIESIDFYAKVAWIFDPGEFDPHDTSEIFTHKLGEVLYPGKHITVDLRRQILSQIASLKLPPNLSQNEIHADLMVTAYPKLVGATSPTGSESAFLSIKFDRRFMCDPKTAAAIKSFKNNVDDSMLRIYRNNRNTISSSSPDLHEESLEFLREIERRK